MAWLHYWKFSTHSYDGSFLGAFRRGPGDSSKLWLCPWKLQLDHPVPLWESVLCLWILLAYHAPTGNSKFSCNNSDFQLKVKLLSHVWLLATLWTVAHHSPPSTGFAGRNTGVGCLFLLHPRDQTWVSRIAGRLSEPPGNPWIFSNSPYIQNVSRVASALCHFLFIYSFLQ